MFAKSTIVLALFAVSAQLAVATSPACLLAAVNTEPVPSNLTAVCGADASKVEAQIQNLCGNNTDAAMSAFTSVCSSAGKTIPTASSGSSSGSSSGMVTSGASQMTSSVTSHSTVTSTAGGSGSTGGASSSTGAPLNPASGGKATSASSSSSTSTGGTPHASLGSFVAAVVAAAVLVLGL